MSKCYLYDFCNRKDCDKDFCLRKYKMDSLYSAALMTESQKQHIILNVDADGTDLEQFKQLAAIEQDIVNKIEEIKQKVSDLPTDINIKEIRVFTLISLSCKYYF